jgi:hypothetical protein
MHLPILFFQALLGPINPVIIFRAMLSAGPNSTPSNFFLPHLSPRQRVQISELMPGLVNHLGIGHFFHILEKKSTWIGVSCLEAIEKANISGLGFAFWPQKKILEYV